jgi:aromatic-L-amino-acid/L-tryptophan decarboxylase
MESPNSNPGYSLDPADWTSLRKQAHRMLDDMFDYLASLPERPVWQEAPQEVKAAFSSALPRSGSGLADVYEAFTRNILPYTIGNVHPGFMGWVQGGGTPVGMLAEMLAAGLNANVGGRNQIPVEVERQIVRWAQELFSFPESASGLFVTGSSMANMIAVLVARTAALGTDVRYQGLANAAPAADTDSSVNDANATKGRKLVAYTSAAAHQCIAQALDLTGMGTAALRRIPFDAAGRMNTAALKAAIARDRANGLEPFLVVGTAGTVDIGAVDPLQDIAAIARQEALWFHVDGAYGALAVMSAELAPRVAGIELADSIAFDFHKWAQVQYDAGFILVRDGRLHEATFASPAAYLARETEGMAANSPWMCDFGPDLSRGFRALKTWMSIKTYGTDKLGEVMSGSCALAHYLKTRIESEDRLELMAPVALNIVCFRYRCGNADEANRRIVIALQKSGIAAPSTTLVNGHLAIRTALFNHRTRKHHVDALLEGVLRFGRDWDEQNEQDDQDCKDKKNSAI